MSQWWLDKWKSEGQKEISSPLLELNTCSRGGEVKI